MQSDLELLLKLQVIDYDLGELERSKEYLPDMMGNLHREIRETQGKLQETRELLQQAQLKQKNLELEIKTKESDLTRYQQQMMTIKTNKEYDALVAEIDSIKSTITTRETELLETIESIATLEKEVTGLQDKDSQIAENNSKQLAILQEKVDSIGAKVAEKETERQTVINSVSRPTLMIYERIRRGKGGSVVVVVKKRACSSCYKALTAKKVQEIKRNDRIETCDNCGCLLYWDEGESN
ncbi:MAG: C4-type zinc ribbon domain-containing protein [Candidatus Zixiibacteriota bacterium]